MAELIILLCTIFYIFTYLPQIYTLYIKRRYRGYNFWGEVMDIFPTLTLGGVALYTGIGIFWVICYVSCAVMALLCVIGWFYARKHERKLRRK